MDYQGNNFRLLPGLIKQRIHYMLIQKIKRNSSITPNYYIDSDNDKAEMAAVAEDILAESDNKLQLEELLKQLTPMQKDILEKLDLQNINVEAIAKNYGCSVQAVYQTRRRAFATLQRIIRKKPANSSTIHRHEKQKLA